MTGSQFGGGRGLRGAESDEGLPFSWSSGSARAVVGDCVSWAQVTVVSHRRVFGPYRGVLARDWEHGLKLAWRAYQWEVALRLGSAFGTALAREVEFFTLALARL